VAAPAPGGLGWVCDKFKSEPEEKRDLYRCERPVGSGDVPPGGAYWACVKSSASGGTRCEELQSPPAPPGPKPSGAACYPGQRMWCDGPIGWGQVECDLATKTWKTTIVDGNLLLDCQESLAGGKVPDTVCACYHALFNPSCCERVDCVVPEGTTGQVCAPSPGQLCDYCDPMKPSCGGPDATCVTTNAHETFCGASCTSQPCPAGYTCMTVKLQAGTTKQCVPSDMSCYY
jgi:hypothetical protein